MTQLGLQSVDLRLLVCGVTLVLRLLLDWLRDWQEIDS
jgi:hypothetical protein